MDWRPGVGCLRSRATALDARREGFDMILIADATRPATGVRFETTT
jgi:nicotinamidase-related amidase